MLAWKIDIKLYMLIMMMNIKHMNNIPYEMFGVLKLCIMYFLAINIYSNNCSTKQFSRMDNGHSMLKDLKMNLAIKQISKLYDRKCVHVGACEWCGMHASVHACERATTDTTVG